MTKQRRFTKEIEDEAVRLVATSGCTRRAVAEDLGIGLSTLVRWIGRSRDRLTAMPDAALAKQMIHHSDRSSRYCFRGPSSRAAPPQYPHLHVARPRLNKLLRT